jgi:hypothetical protein
LAGSVPEEDRDRVIKLRGLPYSISEVDMCTFFKEFKVMPDDVVIEVMYGKSSGYALVYF